MKENHYTVSKSGYRNHAEEIAALFAAEKIRKEEEASKSKP